MVRKGDLNRDYEVAGGDIIFVERAPRAYITAKCSVRAPFRMERAMTVQQALSAGGGLTQRGTQRGMQISAAARTASCRRSMRRATTWCRSTTWSTSKRAGSDFVPQAVRLLP
jgi:hypothetical protein